jgi:hypothetical protein
MGEWMYISIECAGDKKISVEAPDVSFKHRSLSDLCGLLSPEDKMEPIDFQDFVFIFPFTYKLSMEIIN